MNYTMIRDKNMLRFTSDDNKNYAFDVNTGIFYGVSNKPVKTLPNGMSTWLSDNKNDTNALYLLDSIRRHYWRYNVRGHRMPNLTQIANDFGKYFNLVDRIQSIGYVVKDGYDFDLTSLDYIEQHFKIFVKYIKGLPEDRRYNCIRRFMSDMSAEIFAESHNLTANEYLNESMIREIAEFCRRNPQYDTPQYVSLIVYYMTRGLCEFLSSPEDRPDHSYKYGKGLEYIRNYFQMCEALEIIPQKENFFSNYIKVIKEYQLNKEKIDNKKITDHYAKTNLYFEDDNFFTYIPQNQEDFKREADAQSNCVHSMYMRKVMNHSTSVVFIRRKDAPDTSLITCEVANNGEIWQYLARFNRRVPEHTPEYDFYLKYRSWLYTNFKTEW